MPLIEKKGKKCVVCKEEDRNATIFPCRHTSIGIDCLSKNRISACPECFGYIQQYMKLFI